MSASRDSKRPFGEILAKVSRGEMRSPAQETQLAYDGALNLIKHKAMEGLYQISIHALAVSDAVKRRLFEEGKFVFRTLPGDDFCEMLEVVMWDKTAIEFHHMAVGDIRSTPTTFGCKAQEMFFLARKMRYAIEKAKEIMEEAMTQAELRGRSMEIRSGRFHYMDEIAYVLQKEKIQVELETRQVDPFCDFEDAAKYETWVVRW